MSFEFLNILIPIITFVVVIGVSVKVILSSGMRATISAIIYFLLIGLYKWYTKAMPNMNLYTYILDKINSQKLLWWSFFLLIFIIQYFMLFDYSIKNMSRSFNPESLAMCISLCLLCNILLSMSTISQIIAKADVEELMKGLINPSFSTLIMIGIFVITYFTIFVLRQFFSM